MDYESVAKVLPDSRWIGACLARAKKSIIEGRSRDEIARRLYEEGAYTLKKAREIVEGLKTSEFTSYIEPREKIGSAENPVTKLFPAAITEMQFLEAMDRLREERPSIDYHDERFNGHTLVDFNIIEGDRVLPINVKNAGTRFENAAQLVGLDPDDCIPIPAYKAYDAIEKVPNLLYAISIDYSLIDKIKGQLLPRFSYEETKVWNLLNRFGGARIRDAEDKFVYSMVNKHWEEFSKHVSLPEFRIISARKAVRILQTMPKRTPGIGLRAWGTGASAEVNVHISVGTETKSWSEIDSRINHKGLEDIIEAVNRKKTEVVYDPEI